jgi:acetylornithine deacetylase/succinyl-diaminopimelate desuccinylase-like protein
MTGIPDLERTDVDVRIGVTQTARDIAIELADDIDREALKAKVDAALTGAVDVLWLTDKKGRDVAVAAAKIAYVEVGNAEGDRRIGFGG